MLCTQDEAKQQAQKLEETLSAGKQAALKTISRLETNAHEQREEAAALREEMLADHHASIAALNGEVRVLCHGVMDVSVLVGTACLLRFGLPFSRNDICQ